MPDSRGRRRGRPKIRPRTWRKIRRWGFIALAGVVALLVIASFALQSFPGPSPGSSGRTDVVEGIGRSAQLTGAAHVPDGQVVTYSTIPPTSGSHWGAPTACGVYDEEIPDERVVHNMEHGHVIISHNLSSREEIERLEQLAEELPDFNTWGIVRPYLKIDEGTVAIAAWGVIDEVGGLDEERIRRFYEAYLGNRFSEETRRLGRSIPCTSATQRG